MTSDKSRTNSPDPVGSVDESGETGAPPRTIVACDRCRRSKLRCSRDRPACSHCVKSSNVCRYEPQRMKPGVKVGAIDNIYRRLEKLEDEAARRRQNDSSPSEHAASSFGRPSSSAQDVLALLAEQLPRLISATNQTKSPVLESQETWRRSSKRTRIERDSTGEYDFRDQRQLDEHDASPPLPSPAATKVLVDTYFKRIHPWVPMLHQDRFRESVHGIAVSPRKQVILQAIAITVSRYLGEESSNLLQLGNDARWPHDRIRDWILQQALAQVTLEGLQALIIVVFNDIGSGNATRAWSLVASLSRTVQFSQLTTDEYDDSQPQPICQPYSCLSPAQDWTEREERRRVFWNVFMLDRFCSITMGWNACLTSIDVHQRLPCDGFLWRREEGGMTPYLGIWDRGNGGMMDRHSSSGHNQMTEQASALDSDAWAKDSSLHMSPGQGEVDMSKVGAFGYCVEAFESMSRVTSYFLQQRVNVDDQGDVKRWLDRFRELDMRLVHWRLFVPRKWTSTTNDPLTLKMDPNLTLAHITHNTSTILLHQVIAYPPPHWPFSKKLPSAWSAETCTLAAIEISTITQKYLGGTAGDLAIVSHAFAFCVYIAARVMITHWRYALENELFQEFWALLDSLEDMSKRWRGGRSPIHSEPGTDIAARYCRQLRILYEQCAEDENYRIDVTAYTQEFHGQESLLSNNNGLSSQHRNIDTSHANTSFQGPPAMPNGSLRHQSYVYNGGQQGSPNGPMSLSAHPPQFGSMMQAPVGSISMQTSENNLPTPTPNLESPIDLQGQQAHSASAGAIFNATLDQYYNMDMDRVIAFNDGSLFIGEYGNTNW